jgi:type IV secretion system protein VirB9
MKFFKVVFIIGTAVSLFAQDPGPQAPVQARRLPPEKIKTEPSPSATSPLDRYDFGAQLTTLQNGLDPKSSPPALSERPLDSTNTDSSVPPGYRPKTDVQLTPTAQEAVQMSENWMAEHNQAAAGRDGRVLYSYGAGLPTVVCAPLRVCMIELQSGENWWASHRLVIRFVGTCPQLCTAAARRQHP